MRRPAISCLIAVLGFASVVGQENQPRFRAGVNLVLVSAVVRDSQNQLVRQLPQEAFELREDGKPVQIASFAEIDADDRQRNDDGRFIVLLLDNVAVAPEFAYRIKEIAHGFASRMSARDVMSVVLLNGSNATTTSRVTEVRAAIDRYKHFGTTIMPGSSLGRHGVETMGELATQLSKATHRRKVLVSIGPAELFNPDLSSLTKLFGEDRAARGGTIEKSLRDLSRANLTVYVIDPLGLTSRHAPRPAEAATSENQISRGAGVLGNLEGFARETGGLAVSNLNVFEPAIEQIWEETGSYYLIGYEPARGDGRLRTIDVQVRRPGLAVRARRTRG